MWCSTDSHTRVCALVEEASDLCQLTNSSNCFLQLLAEKKVQKITRTMPNLLGPVGSSLSSDLVGDVGKRTTWPHLLLGKAWGSE